MTLDALRAGLLSAWSVTNIGSQSLPDTPPAPPDDIFEDVFPSSIQRFGDRFCLSFDGLARFDIDPAEKRITLFEVQAKALLTDLEHLLYDHVVPRILADLGTVVLHGSAVEIDGRLAVFLGNTGAGKSTLAASLHEAGHLLLGDDAVVVSNQGGEFSGSAVYPTLRLFPDAIDRVLGSAVETSPMAHYSDKLRVNLALASDGTTGTFPLGSLFFLGGDRGETDPRAEKLAPSASCMALVEQSFALDPKDPGKAAKRLRELSLLAGTIPGYRLTYPRDFDRIDELHQMIFSCMAQASENAPGENGAMAG